MESQRKQFMSTSTSPVNPLYELLKSSTIVDLSVTTGNDLPVSPAEGQRFQQFVANYYTWPRGEFLVHVQVHDDHTGTHIDAPCHMIPSAQTGLPHANQYGSITVDQLPIEQMMGPAVVVDCRKLIDGFPKGEGRIPKSWM
jgi:kynurenine formamidase